MTNNIHIAFEQISIYPHERMPDYYVHESEEWLAFPHELDGLTCDESCGNRPHIAGITNKIDEFKKQIITKT